eukprot:s3046_g8.t1
MPTLHRPAWASVSAGNAAKKRPANGSIKEVVGELQAGLGDQNADEGEEGQLAVRDKQKAQKFHKMMSQGALPDHIVHMFNVESKKAKEGQRAYQSKLINQLFSKNDDGTYRLQTDRQEFQEYRAVFHQSIAKDKTESLSRTVMLASHFHGNETLMKKAIDNGELVAKRDPESQIECLQFRKLSSAEVRGNEEGARVQGAKKISREQAHVMSDVMMKLKWKFQLTKAEEKAVDETNEIPESVKKLATKAKDACERLLKDGSKLVSNTDLQKLVKDGYKTLTNNITNLNNLLMFQELPDKALINKVSLENFIGNIALDVDKYNGEIQAAKARAKAKS